MTAKLEGFLASPEKLKQQDAEARNSSPESISIGSDFGSYARANRGSGLTGSGIEHHNLIASINRVRIYRDAIGKVKIATVADLGCGLGFTTSALAQIFATSTVTGYEISRDACEFARKTWPDLTFIPEAVCPNTKLNAKYDLIVAQEFYPFTRTNDPEIHESFINTITQSLTENGIALLTLTEGSPESILIHAGHLARKLEASNISMTVFSLPFDRIYAILPIYTLAKFASNLLSVLLKKPRFVAVAISRKR